MSLTEKTCETRDVVWRIIMILQRSSKCTLNLNRNLYICFSDNICNYSINHDSLSKKIFSFLKYRRWKYGLKGSSYHHHVNEHDFIICKVCRKFLHLLSFKRYWLILRKWGCVSLWNHCPLFMYQYRIRRMSFS